MPVLALLQRNIKWRFHNAFTVIITILQPVLWLVLYSAAAEGTMQSTGIENYTAFILPGLIVLVSFGSCSSSGMMNYLMKADGSFFRILIAPVRRSSIVLGQLLEAVLCTFLEVGILCLLSLFFSVRIFTGPDGFHFISLLAGLLLVFMTAFAVAGFTYALSLTLPDAAVYETAMNAVVLPVFFLSSALFPADRITSWLHTAVRLNPFTRVIDALRALLSGGSAALGDFLSTLLILAVLCCLCFFWAISRLEKQTGR